MKTLLVILNKGGVGKTTVVRTLGLELARRGLNIVMIDTDPQGTLTESLGLPVESGFYDWVARGAEFSKVVRSVPESVYSTEEQPTKGWAGVVPSNWESQNVSKAPVSPISIRQKLSDVREVFDVDMVIFDPPPSESEVHPWLIYAADYILLPTQCMSESYASLQKTMGYIQTHQSFRQGMGLPDTQVIGILPTLYDPRGVIVQKEFLDFINDDYPNLVWEPICNRTDWGWAAAHKRSIVAQAPLSAAAQEAEMMVQRVVASTGLAGRLKEAEHGQS